MDSLKIRPHQDLVEMNVHERLNTGLKNFKYLTKSKEGQ